jgi:hypothetical protein
MKNQAGNSTIHFLAAQPKQLAFAPRRSLRSVSRQTQAFRANRRIAQIRLPGLSSRGCRRFSATEVPMNQDESIASLSGLPKRFVSQSSTCTYAVGWASTKGAGAYFPPVL